MNVLNNNLTVFNILIMLTKFFTSWCSEEWRAVSASLRTWPTDEQEPFRRRVAVERSSRGVSRSGPSPRARCRATRRRGTRTCRPEINCNKKILEEKLNNFHLTSCINDTCSSSFYYLIKPPSSRNKTCGLRSFFAIILTTWFSFNIFLISMSW